MWRRATIDPESRNRAQQRLRANLPYGRRDQACSRELLPGAACGFDNFHIVRIQYGEFCRALRDAHEARDVRFAHDLLLVSILHFRIPDKSSVWESTVEEILEEVRLRQPVRPSIFAADDVIFLIPLPGVGNGCIGPSAIPAGIGMPSSSFFTV
jgi:hypothetical protein